MPLLPRIMTRNHIHTGVAIFVGKALVYWVSRKQKCVTKSPTESKLVALTDYIGLVELFAEFVAFITNSPVQVPIIYYTGPTSCRYYVYCNTL